MLATAYSDPNRFEGTGLNEPVLWVKNYARGRVVNCILGHDVESMRSPGFQALAVWALEWAATGQVSAQLPPPSRRATTHRGPRGVGSTPLTAFR